MQKHASSFKKAIYPRVFRPLPVSAEETVYYDRAAISLSYAEDFPHLHYHDRYEIGICEEGEGLIVADGRFFSISKGDWMFIPPGVCHYSRSLHPDALCQCRFVYIRSDSVRAELPGEWTDETLSVAVRRIPLVIRVDEFPSAVSLLSEILSLCGEDAPYRDHLITMRLALLLLETSRWFLPFQKVGCVFGEKKREEKNAAQTVAEFLSLHYAQSHMSHELAALCHLSESQLRRQFAVSYGMSPLAFRTSLRCRIAKELLRYSELSVAQISEHVGYGMPSDFYRVFRKEYGISPSAYRKKYRE